MLAAHRMGRGNQWTSNLNDGIDCMDEDGRDQAFNFILWISNMDLDFNSIRNLSVSLIFFFNPMLLDSGAFLHLKL